MKRILLSSIGLIIVVFISYVYTAYIFNSFSFYVLPGWEGIVARFLSIGAATFLSGLLAREVDWGG
jgi:hypothetical protein